MPDKYPGEKKYGDGFDDHFGETLRVEPTEPPKARVVIAKQSESKKKHILSDTTATINEQLGEN